MCIRDSTYEVELTVTDPGNLTASKPVTITVTDVNDAPVFPQANPTFSATENQSTVGTLFATDAEVRGVVAVSAYRHSLFIDANGSLWAMGENGSGQLGDGSHLDRSTPVKVVDDSVSAIAAGEAHSLFLKTDGSLWAMGLNSSGQLGDGTTTTRSTPVKVVDGNVTAIAAGFSHSLFLKKDGSLWACLLYTSPSPRDATLSRMPSSA